MEDGTVSLLFLLHFVFVRLGRPPLCLHGRADLARELTQQTEDDGSWVVKVDWTYRGKKFKNLKKCAWYECRKSLA